MRYEVSILRRAQKELASLPLEAYEKVKDAILSLAAEPRPMGCKKLTARQGWRIRASDYRILYEIDESRHTILILHIGHRRDVYRKK
jgi:mRNA interferase RelE/StbE